MNYTQLFIDAVLEETHYDLITIGDVFYYRRHYTEQFTPICSDYVGFGIEAQLGDDLSEVSEHIDISLEDLAIVKEIDYHLVYRNKVYVDELVLIKE